MNKLKVRRVAVALMVSVLALSLVLTGCQGKETASGEQATPEKSEIRIGAIVSLTGTNAMTGADQKWAYEQAVADINAAGGIMVADLGKKLPIKLILEDDRSNPGDAAAAMEKLIKLHGIDFAMSSNYLSVNIAAATVAEKYHKFMACCITWLDVFEQQNYKWASDMFYSSANAAEVPFQIWETLPEAERPTRIGLVMEDNPDGQGFAKMFKNFAQKYGYNIVADESYTPGAKDFSSLILKLKSSGVDALLWFGTPTDSIVLVRQMKELNFSPKYVHGWKGFWPVEFVEALGDDADYIIHDGHWVESLPYPGAAELGKRYRQEHGGRDSTSVGVPYANVQVLAQAIERAGSLDSAKVRDEVFGGKFTGTVLGDLEFNEKGLCFFPSLALQWYKGERKIVYPATGDWKLRRFVEWDKR